MTWRQWKEVLGPSFAQLRAIAILILVAIALIACFVIVLLQTAPY